MRNKDTILDMTAGQRGQFTCDIIAPEGMDVELVGAVNLSGTPTQLALQSDNLLVTPPMPPGFWLVEIRAGGVTILHGHLNVLQSPLADNAGEANFHVSADITQPLVHTTITFAAGPRGKSAYDIWLDSGHEGDLQAFLASLKGEKGDTGERGPQGEQGIQGVQGIQGETGKSAFRFAVDSGYTGTEEEFAAGLQASAECADNAAASAAAAEQMAGEAHSQAEAAAGAKNDVLALQSALEAHLPAEGDLADKHVTGTERMHLQRLIAEFPAVDPDTPSVSPLPVLPADSIPWERIEQHFAAHAQPGTNTAPSRVYVSRVPWARKENNQWVNNSSTVNESVFGVPRKFMDNAPGGVQKKHTCSTNTTVGADDYIGKEWAFYCHRCNYKTDEYGNKHIVAIQGQTINGASFTPAENVGTFGPRFWFFVCLERYQDPETGEWLTADGTEEGEPLFQLWGISSRSWADLDDDRKAELIAHGVTEADYHLWPECLIWDETEQALVERPYYIHSAYMGGYEIDGQGQTHFVSKPNCPLWNNLSHNLLQDRYGWKRGMGGSATVNGFGVLFDIVKNANKNSQSIHTGMSSNNCSAITASATTAEPGRIFPVSSQGNFRVGCTVWLNRSSYNSTNTPLGRSLSVQIGRITAIENRTFLNADGVETTALCLVFDEATVEPFYVRTNATDCAAISESYAHCHATQGIAMAGETDLVQGKHDGSVSSYSDSKHPYRVQLTEYMGGIWMCAADTVAIKGTGGTDVVIDGVTVIPTSSQYVIMQAGQRAARRNGGSLANYRDGGYKAVGLASTTAGYIVNAAMSSTGVLYPVATGGTGASTGAGHGDNFWVGASPAEFLLGGSLINPADAGSASLYLDGGISHSYWSIGGRD